MIDVVEGHTAWLMDRGGRKKVDDIRSLGSVQWGRVRDDISEAAITVSGEAASSQRELLAGIEPGRHELCLFRGDERVWEGPITLASYSRSGVKVEAKDVMHYAARTAMHAKYSSAFPNVEKAVERARRILVAELARKEGLTPPVNIVPYIVAHQTPTDAETTTVTLPYEMTVFEHIDNMAARGGIDYTVLGRAIHLWDVSRPAMGQTPTVTENDFLGDLVVSVYGAELGTVSISTDGQGVAGIAGGIDPYYGEWERLNTAYDEEKDETVPSLAVLEGQARRNLAGRNPTPVQVRVPDGSSLNPNGVLSMSDLVPGVYIPVRATLNLREVIQMQKLSSVTVKETPKGETISVSMYPASQSDDAEAV